MSESFEYDNLFGGSQKKPVQSPAVVAIGQAWSRGTLVGKLTSTGKWQLVDFDAVSNFNDFGIAAEAVDSREGETKTTVFVEGEFNENVVEFGNYGDDADDWRNKLADHGIYLRRVVTAEGVE